MYISMPQIGADTDVEDELAFYQVLALAQTVVTADRCAPLTVAADSKYIEISVQPLERMLPALASQAEVFSFVDELPIAMHVAIGSSGRRDILQWDHVGPSSYDDCIALREPRPIQPIKTTLLDLPTLSVLDRLESAGWVGDSRKMKHTLGGAKVYDDRRPVSCRRYYQRLLILDELLGPTDSFTSGNSQAFYLYLLRFRKLPPAGATAKQLQSELKASTAADDIDLGPQLPPLPLPAAPAAETDFDELAIVMDSPDHDPNPIPKHRASSNSHGDEFADDVSYSPTSPGRSEPDSESDVEPPGPPGPPGPPAAEAEPQPAEADPDDAIDELAVPAPVELVRAAPDEWPLQLEGYSLIKIAGRRGGGHNVAIRLGVTCLCCGFFKTRSTALNGSVGAKGCALVPWCLAGTRWSC
jgi:hypothetical protein